MPKIVDRKKKQEEILHAAFNVFARKGFFATKMTDIAREAGIGKGTIYEYFKSKKEVFSNLYSLLAEDFDREFKRQIATLTNPIEKIKLIVQIYFVDVIDRYGDFMKIVMDFWMAEARADTTEDTNNFNLLTIYAHYIDLIAEVIEEGIEQKLFRRVNSRHYAAMLIAIFDGLYLQFFLQVNKSKPADIAHSIIHLFLSGLTNPNQE